ncbi:aconitate hydratase AcnA [Herbaspirillum sp. alder98]|uniref:aconitate hydratase AcnA n=1 Tax=Herbaspirillum sp. alder98 TaxID=2913096 RepID=UPI001CD84F5E|nr:aconitate hydratase AcnA [Herbaspirillum sp. alder98]MCA1324735.1 aconitate hydratase AcnA [Herbaspirillum sp. alder98]
MRNSSTFEPGVLTHAGDTYLLVDLPTQAGGRLRELPVVLRILLENIIRHEAGEERQASVAAILEWLDKGTSEAEIAFQPGRVLMHDTTSTPALVDIAAMRDALAEAGWDPTTLNPGLPVDISVDHSLAVEFFAEKEALERNLKLEIRRNSERYSFLRWASKVMRGVRIHPPGTGIMHTINLEQLATVVTTERREGKTWVVPDTLIGTDSHTPMINGIGVLGWGVGGLEAQTVMFGMPTMMRIPDVIGVRLSGRLKPGVQATDLALTITQRLRAIGVSGEYVEFYGPGIAALSAGERSVVANMAPEYGASSGYFPIDEATLAYLRDTGRPQRLLELTEQYARRNALWYEPDNAPRYTRTIDVDLDQIEMFVAGPRRPQDLLPFGQLSATVAALGFTPRHAGAALPRHPIAIAAITSCTNTSDPALLVAAGLVARKARALGLKVPHWVKTSLGPGSPAAAAYLERAGLIDDLCAVGFDIVGYGCTTCIGNSGPLTAPVQQGLSDGDIYPVAALSGNRNFPGRVHPDLDLGFLMSPALVVAMALAGDAMIDLATMPVQHTSGKQPVFLADLWPDREEIAAAVKAGVRAEDFPKAFAIATENPLWHALQVPQTPLFPWSPTSTALRRPPFASLDEGSQLGSFSAYPLLVLGDDITTDHISPASAIPANSFVADFLVERGDDRNDLNVFASRRGNWEVMVRAAFYNKTLRNLLAPAAPVGQTLHIPSGDVAPIHEVAERYRKAGESVVLVAGERYGTGSSRDWAAKGQRLLGIRAVLAMSFERIHRSNLIGMGILPLRLPDGMSPAALDIRPGDRIEVDADAATLQPRCDIPVRLVRCDGKVESFIARAAVETQLETTLLQRGGVIPFILRNSIELQRRS